MELFLLLTVFGLVHADYECLCNYNVEKSVYPVASETDQPPMGYMYEFDCKGTVHSQTAPDGWTTIAFEHQIGYVLIDGQTANQICAGSIPDSDRVTTLKPTTVTTTTTERPTTMTTTTTQATTKPRTTETTTTTTITTSTTTSTPQPTTPTTQPTTSTTPPTTTTTTTTTPQPSTSSTISSTTTTTASTMSTTTLAKTTPLVSTAPYGPVVCPQNVLDSTKHDGGTIFVDQTARKCFEFVPSKHSWSYAEGLCQHNGGHLASITSMRQNELIHNNIKSNGRPVWIGLQNRNQQYVWTSGEQLIFQNWEPNHGTEDCVAMDDVTGTWEDSHCSMYYAFICEYAAVSTNGQTTFPATPRTTTTTSTTTTTTAAQMSPDGNINLCSPQVIQRSYQSGHNVGQFGDACYELIKNIKVTWSNAENRCIQNGGHLAYIRSSQEQTFVQAFMSRHYRNHAVWIGLHDLNFEDSFQWTSGKSVTYTNWVPGHRGNFFNHNLEDCVLFIPYENGRWDDIPCGQPDMFGNPIEVYSFVCQYVIHTQSSVLIG